MSLQDEAEAHCGSMAGRPAPAAKISRFPALSDQPGRSTGYAVWLADGDLLLSAAHPNSTFILHGQGRCCWLEG
ncbi:hypothetical protein SA496_20205 [Pseudomonas sp. JS3066]|uniref:hypothetical protein n=1 Tax=Pseudomonas sp. JS3066 TaxID=3090665 RepID=UPI002E7AD4C6|nr:hypothetical protein [Pseudomonas sp. JS3066]WVK92025.1 hypothetical protein SA496_20205 [Pseudomonas sp. JS3066]